MTCSRMDESIMASGKSLNCRMFSSLIWHNRNNLWNVTISPLHSSLLFKVCRRQISNYWNKRPTITKSHSSETTKFNITTALSEQSANFLLIKLIELLTTIQQASMLRICWHFFFFVGVNAPRTLTSIRKHWALSLFLSAAALFFSCIRIQLCAIWCTIEKNSLLLLELKCIVVV